MRDISSVGVIGSGSWGTALAILLASKGLSINLWMRSEAYAQELTKTRINSRYLSNVFLPENITPTSNLDFVEKVDCLLLVVPTQVMRGMCQELQKFSIPENVAIVSCAKGIEKGSLKRMSQIAREFFPRNEIAILSGPNHAEEISRQLPAAAVIGCENDSMACHLQKLFSTSRFRVYTSRDVAGIELGGAMKNVFAIAAGIAEGLGLGDNATAALVTRALAELRRLGIALGGKAETFMGLSGIGDLMVTCYSTHSRNNRVGRGLAQGKPLDEILTDLGMVAEGVPNTLALYETARQHGVRTPIIDAIYAILYRQLSPAKAIEELLTRDPRAEIDQDR